MWPQYLEEMRGIAEGAGVAFADILAINTRTEVMFAAKAAHAGTARAAARVQRVRRAAEASADGRTLMGQNWDWLLHSADTCVLLEARQEGAPTSSRSSRPACWRRRA